MIVVEALLVALALAAFAYYSLRTGRGLPLITVALMTMVGATFDATGHGDRREVPYSLTISIVMLLIGLAAPRINAFRKE